MSNKGFTGFGMSENDFKEMIRAVIADELKVVVEKMQVAKPQQASKKEMLTRKEVIEEYEICSTKLYNLNKANILVPKKLAGGRRHYYFREELDKHFK